MNTGHWSNAIQCRRQRFLSASWSTTNPLQGLRSILTRPCSCGSHDKEFALSAIIQHDRELYGVLNTGIRRIWWLATCYGRFHPDENVSCTYWIRVGWATELVWTLWRREKPSPDSPTGGLVAVLT